MRKSWWLKLYTIPQMKFLAVVYLVVTTIACLGMWLAPEHVTVYLLSYLFPVFVFFAGGVDGIYHNLEFHKLTVPLKNLRWIFFKDTLLQFVGFLSLTFLALLIPMKIFYGDANIKLHPMLLILFGTPSYTLFALAIFVSFSLNSRTIRINVRDRSEVLPFIVLVLVFGLLLWKEQVFVAYTVLLVTLNVRFYHFMQTKFHRVSPRNVKTHYALASLVALFTVMYTFGCAYHVRYEMNATNYSVGSKYKTMYVFSEFLPTLEPETVRVMMKYPVAVETVFRNAHPDVYKMPIEMFITKKDLRIISLYLKYGTPSEDNLTYLMRQMSFYSGAEEWENYSKFEETRNLLVKHWPDASTLPVELLDRPTGRGIASENE